MVARIRLTPPRVAEFTCPPGKAQAFLHDTEAPGLALRATRAGSKAYTFEARLHGRTLRLTIGDPRAHTTGSGTPRSTPAANADRPRHRPARRSRTPAPSG